MAFSKCTNEDGSINHRKAFDPEKNVTLEVKIDDEGKFIILSKDEGKVIKMTLGTDRTDTYVCLPEGATDRLRVIIREALESLDYRDAIFLEYKPKE